MEQAIKIKSMKSRKVLTPSQCEKYFKENKGQLMELIFRPLVRNFNAPIAEWKKPLQLLESIKGCTESDALLDKKVRSRVARFCSTLCWLISHSVPQDEQKNESSIVSSWLEERVVGVLKLYTSFSCQNG